MGEDHLVPMNKECLGLHAWGNIVPSCKPCNDVKHFKNWEVYLKTSCGSDAELCELRTGKIRAFLAEFKYEPNLQLQSIANNLYQDVGAVAMTLIDLRFKQADAVIRQIQALRQE